ncbi:hypothetical protein C6502_16815 [Candidatus Poribacteria bacterium]|nr:MAG: hypothetical protein C6502_16815 [Candidatus Poribacteria bacterium]
MAFRFSVAVIICLLLVVTNTIVLIDDYKSRLASYNTAAQKHWEEAKNAETYSQLTVSVDRPPNPLSIFNQGLDRRLGNSVDIHHSHVPALWDTASHSADNPFLSLFSSIDLLFIFQVIFSLMALLFAYDAIAGEREGGTLRLMLTTPVQRGSILFAKYISAMLCLIVPLIMSLLLSLILYAFSQAIVLSGDDWVRIGGILLTSIVYLSAFYLIGLLLSTLTQRTATALMLSMLLWGTLVLIYPSASIFAVNRLVKADSKLEAAYEEIQQIWEEFDRVRTDLKNQDPFKGENMYGSVGIGSGTNADSTTLRYYSYESINWNRIDDEKSGPQIPHVKTYYKSLESQRIRAAEKTWLVRQEALKQIYVRKASVAQTVMRLSPAAMYDMATEAWAGTDFHGIEDFLQAARQYRQTLIHYLEDKDTFASRQWFASDKGAVNLDDLPQFTYRRTDALTGAKRAMPDVAALLLINVVLFLTTLLIFIKQEV